MSKKMKLNQAVIRDEREQRGLSKEQMADVLGLDGQHAVQILTDFEAGFREPKGAVVRVYESLNRQRWNASHLLEIPAWSLSADGQFVHHHEWPRFVGRVLLQETHPSQWQFKKAGMPAFALDESSGFRQIVFSLTDHVPDDLDIEDLYFEAIRLVENFAKNGNGHG